MATSPLLCALLCTAACRAALFDWERLADGPATLSNAASVVVDTDSWIFFGGATSSSSAVRKYSFSTSTWTTLWPASGPTLPTGTYAVALPGATGTGARVLVSGYNQFAASLYFPTNNTYVATTPDYPATVTSPATCGISGTAYMFHGRSITGQLANSFLQYFFVNATWVPITVNLDALYPSTARIGASVAASSGGLWFFGGVGESETVQLDEFWNYDIASGSFTRLILSGAPSARNGHTAVVGNNRMWLIGGANTSNSASPALYADVHYYDFDKGTWKTVTASGTAFTARYTHAAAVYGDYVYVYGGRALDVLNDMWRFQFTMTGPSVLSYVADDPDDADAIYGLNDTVTLTFSTATNTPAVLSYAQITSLLSFSPPIGKDLSGKWTSATTLVITILSLYVPAPTISPTATVTVLAGGNLRDSTGNSRPSTSSFAGLTGDWGLRAGPNITSFTASDPNNIDSFLGPGDIVQITFSEDTNMPYYPKPNSTQVLSLLSFGSASIGVFSAIWSSARVLTITFINVSSVTLVLGVSQVQVTGPLYNQAMSSLPSVSVSPKLSGNWGTRKGPYILSMVASDPDNGDAVLSAGDIVTIDFSEPTNTPPATSSVLSNFITFTQSLGALLNGTWVTKSQLVITILDPSGASAVFNSTRAVLLPAGNLKDQLSYSFPSNSTPGPTIISLVASDPDNKDAVYGAGDAVSLTFSAATNTPPVATMQQVDAFLSFTSPLGANYTGSWSTTRVLVLTIVSPTAGKKPQIGAFTTTVIGTLYGISPVSLASTPTSPSLTGNWGTLPGPTIVSLVASDPDNLDALYSVADLITVVFSEATNRPSATDPRTLFTFSQSLGTSFVGKWTNSTTVVINITNTNGAAPPQIGVLTLTTQPGAIYNAATNSLASNCTSPAITGSWGNLPGPSIVSFVADDPDDGDAVYSSGDTMTITFSEATNKPAIGYKTEIDRVFSFNQNIGTNATGVWDSSGKIAVLTTETQSTALRNTLNTSLASTAVSPSITGDWGLHAGPTITSFVAEDPDNKDAIYSKDDTITIQFDMNTTTPRVDTKALMDSVFNFSQSLGADYSGVWSTAHTPAVDRNAASVGSFTVTPIGKILNAAQSSLASVGRLGPQIVALVAADPTNADGIFGIGDTITAYFSENTNQAQQYSLWLSFSQSIGAGHTYTWLNASVLRITVTDASGSYPPVVGQMTATMFGGLLKSEGNKSLPSNTTSPVLTGSWGTKSGPTITSFVASDPDNMDAIYSAGDILVITFSETTSKFDEDTNRPAASTWALLQLFLRFSQAMGTDLTGTWSSASLLVITVVDPTGSLPPRIGELTVSTIGSLLKNANGTSLPSNSTSPTITGNWGTKAGPQITVMVASDPDNLDAVYGPLDTITIVFDVATNKMSVSTKAAVDALLSFNQALGSNYQGAWSSDGRNLTVTVTNVSLAAPPAIGVLVATVRASGNLRINTVFSFTSTLGLDYTGYWPSSSVFVITIVTPAVAAPAIGVLRVSVFASANLQNSNKTSSPSSSTSPVLSGNWGTLAGPTITSVVASDPDNADAVFGNGDVITMYFSAATNQPTVATTAALNSLFTFSAGPTILSFVAADPTESDTVYGNGDTMTITFSQATSQPSYSVSTLFSFSQTGLGVLTGSWTSSTTYVVVVVDASAVVSAPAIGVLTVTSISSYILNANRTSLPCTSTSPPITGNWGTRAGPSITSVVASDPDNMDAVYGNGDTITVQFNRATNTPGVADAAAINTVFSFNQALGSGYKGNWTNGGQTLVITITDSTGASPPTVGVFVITVLAAGNLRDAALKSNPSQSVSPVLTGNWGTLAGPSITSFVASDPTNKDAIYGAGDQLTVQFSANTNTPSVLAKAKYEKLRSHSRADYPTPAWPSIDALLSFSAAIGADYTGFWSSANVLVITIADASISTAPVIGSLVATVKASGNLKNSAGTSLSSTAVSGPLTGNWGTLAGPTMSTLVAADPTNLDAIYGNGDQLYIVFSAPTNTPALADRTAINAVFAFSTPLGASYAGVWTTTTTLVITVLNITGYVAPGPVVGVFTVALNAGQTAIYNLGKTSLPSAGTSPVLSGNWGTLPGPSIVSLVADDPDDRDNTFSSGDTLTINFDMATDQPSAGTKALVDSLLTFTTSIGTSYYGAWVSSTALRITIVDATLTGTAPEIGVTQCRVVGTIRNAAKTSLSSTSALSPVLTGDFGIGVSTSQGRTSCMDGNSSAPYYYTCSSWQYGVYCYATTPVPPYTTEARPGTSQFYVTLLQSPSAVVSVVVSSNDTTAATVTAGSILNYAPLSWSVPQQVTLQGVDDTNYRGNVSYNVVLTMQSSDLLFDGGVTLVSLINVENDYGYTLLSTAPYVVSELGQNATVSLRLSVQPLAQVVLACSTDRPALLSVAPASTVFSPSSWSVARAIVVSTAYDLVQQGDLAFHLVCTFSSTDPTFSSMPFVPISMTRIDGTVYLMSAGLRTYEADPSVAVILAVRLPSAPSGQVAMPLSLSAPLLAAIAPAQLVFTALNWNTTQLVYITGKDNPYADGNATYNVVAGPLVSSDATYSGQVVSNWFPQLTSVDNDVAGFSYTPSLCVTSEDGDSCALSLAMLSPPRSALVFPISTSNTAAGVITSPQPAVHQATTTNWNTAWAITVTGVDDLLQTGDTLYSVIIGPVTCTGDAYCGRTFTVPAKNIDNDYPSIRVAPSLVYTSESGAAATVSVRLGVQPTSAVTFSIACSRPSETACGTSQMTFTASDWNVVQALVLTGVDDSVPDGNQTSVVTLGPSVSADARYSGLISTVTVVNIDNENPKLVVSAMSGPTSEWGLSATFSVHLNSDLYSQEVVTVVAASEDSTRGTVATGPLAFTSADWSTPKAVTVVGTTQSNNIAEGNVTYYVLVSNSQSAYGNLSAVVPVVLLDKDVASIIVSSSTSQITTESGGSASFTVVLSSIPRSLVNVPVTVSDLTEAAASPTSLQFSYANWNVPQTVTITGQADGVVDGNVTYTVQVGPSVSSDALYSGLVPRTFTFVNVDENYAGLKITPSMSPPYTTESGGLATLYVSLTSRPTGSVNVFVASMSPATASVQTPTLTFAVSSYSTAQLVTVAGIDDNVVNGARFFNVSFVATSSDQAYNLPAVYYTLIALDNDDPDAYQVSGISRNTTEKGGTGNIVVAFVKQPPTLPYVVTFTSDTPSVGVVVPPMQYIFQLQDWTTPRLATIQGVNDYIARGNTLYYIYVSPPSKRSLPKKVPVWNIDDDVAGVVFHVSSSSIYEGKTEVIGISLSSQPLGSVTVALEMIVGASLFTISPASVVFSASSWNTTQSVSITANIVGKHTGSQQATLRARCLSLGDAFYNGSISLDYVFTFTQAALLNVTAITPSVAAVNIDPGTFTATGSGFNQGIKVWVDYVAAKTVVWQSSTELTFTCEIQTKEGYRDVLFQNPDGGEVLLNESLYFTSGCLTVGMYGASDHCKSCPTGATCPGGDRVWPDDGYWNSGEGSGFVTKCRPKSRCLGGRDAACASGYTGSFCGSCTKGYYLNGDLCLQCRDWWFYILCAAFAAFVAMLLSSLMGMPKRKLYHMFWAIMFFQAIVAVVKMVPPHMPDFLHEAYADLSVALLDAGDFIRPGCNMLAQSFSQVFLVTLVCAIVLFWAFTFGPLAYGWLVGAYQKSQLRIIRYMLIITMLTYYIVTLRSLQTVVCYRFGPLNESFLAYELGTVCYKETHMAIVVVSYVVLVAYSIPYPVAMLGLLWRHESDLDSAKVIPLFGILYDIFENKGYLFAPLYLMFLFALALINALFVPWRFIHFACCSVLFLGTFVAVLWVRPFRVGAELASCCVMLGAAAYGVLLNFIASFSSVSSAALWVLGIVHLMAIAFAVVAYGFFLWRNNDKPKILDMRSKTAVKFDPLACDSPEARALAMATEVTASKPIPRIGSFVSPEATSYAPIPLASLRGSPSMRASQASFSNNPLGSSMTAQQHVAVMSSMLGPSQGLGASQGPAAWESTTGSGKAPSFADSRGGQYYADSAGAGQSLPRFIGSQGLSEPNTRSLLRTHNSELLASSRGSDALAGTSGAPPAASAALAASARTSQRPRRRAADDGLDASAPLRRSALREEGRAMSPSELLAATPPGSPMRRSGAAGAGRAAAPRRQRPAGDLGATGGQAPQSPTPRSPGRQRAAAGRASLGSQSGGESGPERTTPRAAGARKRPPGSPAARGGRGQQASPRPARTPPRQAAEQSQAPPRASTRGRTFLDEYTGLDD
eukprot:m51a1_g14832 hypothetical protein (4244) ;mRNA; f:692485-711070